MRVAVLITVFNRIDKTIRCLDSLFNSLTNAKDIHIHVYLTDDGSTDGTKELLIERYGISGLTILDGNGSLYWNGGMINSWRSAINEGGFDGYLWLNNDSVVYNNIWEEIVEADNYSLKIYCKRGIYVGSTQDPKLGHFTYGGFVYTNKWTLKDKFILPNGDFQLCQAAHGNITYVSDEVVQSEGIFFDGYIHSGGDHDYSYRAFKKGFPVIVLRDYVGACENDHDEVYGSDFKSLKLKNRIRYLNSPLGFNMKNTLLFQKRCFPYRYFPVLIAGYFKAFFPNIYFRIYKNMRS